MIVPNNNFKFFIGIILHYFKKLLYTVFMLALIPHKDTVNLLGNISKKILLEFNGRKKLSVFPVFPLWGFLDKDPVQPSLMTVYDYKIKEDKLVFPVELVDKDEVLRTEIVFGKINDPDVREKIPVPELNEKFPVFSRVFKTGNAVFENNSWKLYDEKWFKGKN